MQHIHEPASGTVSIMDAGDLNLQPFPFWRVAIGTAILATLAAIDLYQHGKSARRWREYSFLLFCVSVAIVYGIINDQITSRISWEYFYYGKELAPILGPQTPPDESALHWQAVRIGAEATWSAGLIAGAILLMANNPRHGRPGLPLDRLAIRLGLLFACTILFAIVFGFAGYFHLLDWTGSELGEIVRFDIWRPQRFLMVYGIHLGGYFGAVIGTVYIAWTLWRRHPALREGVEK
jgi:hypothetical protein